MILQEREGLNDENSRLKKIEKLETKAWAPVYNNKEPSIIHSAEESSFSES